MEEVVNLKVANKLAEYGGKTTNLAKMLAVGLPVPNGIAVGLSAFNDLGKLNDSSKQKIRLHLDKNKKYAVRSSAIVEDSSDASWAGQFETFLNISYTDVITKVEACHNPAKDRVRAYAGETDIASSGIAVVIQEMLKPEYAGVLFTKDPVDGSDRLVTEYVEGLGESLVSGQSDPTQIKWSAGEHPNAPFSIEDLTKLALKVQKVFQAPQDIEWAWADGQMWLVQTRPITATQKIRSGYYLGEPDELFYWGPSRAKAMYMSDFMTAIEHLFLDMSKDQNLPDPPQTLILFDQGQMVWLNNAQAFATFTEQIFEIYEKTSQLVNDIASWRKAMDEGASLSGRELLDKMVDTWLHTEIAEFSLYGAESSLNKRLSRFDDDTRQRIWGSFTVLDKSTFLNRIDEELKETNDIELMAEKYPWIQDGYDGIQNTAKQYFQERLNVVRGEKFVNKNYDFVRQSMIKKLKLSKDEVNALNLVRKLAEFMDDRKAWMMETRRFITQPAGDIEHGWYFADGRSTNINQDDAHELWQRYIDFKSPSNTVVGIVASNGGRHFVNGEVALVTSPTDNVEDGKIVVVPSTSPSYVPLMRKAKALVTDHGGMMSHAAIVAREFNLPCIVGTKQATKLLKSGDSVVLDLLKGEVITK